MIYIILNYVIYKLFIIELIFIKSTGHQGHSVNLLTNFYEMIQKMNCEIYQYHVDFLPDIDSKRMRKRLLNEHKNIIGEVKAFDGMALFTSKKLDKPVSGN